MPLFTPPLLDDHERAVIQAIEELKARLRYIVQSTPKRWQGLLWRTAMAKNVRGSNSIEGYNVSVEDAIAAQAREEPLDASKDTWDAVTGYQNAMTCVLQVADDRYFRLSNDWIKSLQFMMIHYDLSKNPGKWRPGAIFVRSSATGEIVYEAPEAEHVPGLMDELVQSLTSPRDVPAIIRAAMGHLNLVMIHPFSDGNGRMGRCLQTLILAQAGTHAAPFCSIEEYLGTNSQAYYDVLAEVGAGAWHPERDARPWVRFCLTAHYRQATTLLRRSRQYERLWAVLEEEIKHRKLPERLILALADASIGYSIRNATYRPVAEISEQMASRDLKQAVDAGLLIPHGERRHRFYRGTPRLFGFREAVRETKIVRDPFDGPVSESPENLALPGFERMVS